MMDTKTIIEVVGWVSSSLAIAGCVMNNYKLRWCFVVWLFSNALSAWIHIVSGPELAALAWRDMVFFALAVHGLWAWRRKSTIDDCRWKVETAWKRNPVEIKTIRASRLFSDAAMNALYQALNDCAADDQECAGKPRPEDKDRYDVYEYLEKTPRTSLIALLVEKLRENGFDITEKAGDK